MADRILLPFMPLFRVPMLQGVKVMTCRTRRYGQPGDAFIAFDHEFVLTHVMRMRLGYVFSDCYLQEGCSSERELTGLWAKIHPNKPIDCELIVWAHCFR